MNSRTSCPQRQATAIFAAHCRAASREGTSTTVKPPLNSLVSGYEPSVTVPSTATTTGSTSSSSPPEKTYTPASLACWTTACAASATSGASSSGTSIAALGNEIRYRGIP